MVLNARRESRWDCWLYSICKTAPPLPPFFLLDFLPRYYKLDCFDKFPKAEVKWSFVLKWVTWRVNAQRSEAFHFPIWKESPELSCPLRAPEKRGIDYPWRVEKRDSQCPRSPEQKGRDECENTGRTLSLPCSPRSCMSDPRGIKLKGSHKIPEVFIFLRSH